jgi:hypothetical protein
MVLSPIALILYFVVEKHPDFWLIFHDERETPKRTRVDAVCNRFDNKSKKIVTQNDLDIFTC